MMALVLAAVALLLAAIPALLFLANLRAYRPPLPPRGPLPAVSVLIPARNEEGAIAAAVEAALASRGVALEVVVLDDHSDDGTAAEVGRIAARDARVRLVPGAPLPAGWCGKQHACAQLACSARNPVLAFLDADVRLEPDGLAAAVGFLVAAQASLVSGIPRQETGTLLEKLVIPLIHFVLLGFLPVARMRQSRHPAYGSGCGQLMVAWQDAYTQAGGHGVIRASLHDGIRLPRAFRAAGLATDLFDATPIARCRMYRTAGELWSGLAKNATEGLAAPALLVPASLLLLGGQVLPFALLLAAPWLSPPALALTAAAVALAWLPPLIAAGRFRQSWLGAALHPLGVLALLAIQWYAAARALAGQPSAWKGRLYERARAAG